MRVRSSLALPALALVMGSLGVGVAAQSAHELPLGKGTPTKRIVRPADRPIDPGRVTHVPFLCPSIHPRGLTIVVPTTPPPRDGYPLVIVNDGDDVAGEFRFVQAHDRLVREGAIEPHVIVGLGNTADRQAEYALAPVSFDSLDGLVHDVPRSPDQRYADCVAELLPIYLTEVALVDPRPERTSVIGFSFGGLAALHLAMRHPERVGRVACLSGSLWWDWRRMLRTFEHAPLPTRLYVDAGAMEGEARDAVPYMVEDARALVRIARSRGMKLGEDLGYYEAPLAFHTPNAIGERAESILRFLLSDEKFDLEHPANMRLWLLAPVLRPEQRTTLSLELELPSGVRLTAPNDLAEHEVEGASLVTITRDGLVRARENAVGTTTLVSRYRGFERRARARVMP